MDWKVLSVPPSYVDDATMKKGLGVLRMILMLSQLTKSAAMDS